jgi:hypothetical protein
MRKSSWFNLVACSAAAVVVAFAACRPTPAADRQTDLGRTAGLTRQTDLGRTADLPRQTDLGRTANSTRQPEFRRGSNAYQNAGSVSKSRPSHLSPLPRAMAYPTLQPMPSRPIYRPR